MWARWIYLVIYVSFELQLFQKERKLGQSPMYPAVTLPRKTLPLHPSILLPLRVKAKLWSSTQVMWAEERRLKWIVCPTVEKMRPRKENLRINGVP